MDIRAVFFQLREQNWNELFEIERNEWSEWKNKIKCEKKRTKEDIMTYYYTNVKVSQDIRNEGGNSRKNWTALNNGKKMIFDVVEYCIS